MKFAEFSENVEVKHLNWHAWRGTSVEPIACLDVKTRGSMYEQMVQTTLEKMGCMVEAPANPGHDRIVDGYKVEIKFGLATRRNYDYGVMFNHIGFHKDWDIIILGCVNGDETVRMVAYRKEDLPTECLTKQQGGNKSENDDFMVSCSNSKKILFHEKAYVIC